MLELYQAYADWTDMMELIESLVSELAIEVSGSTSLVYQGRPLDLTPPWRRATMAELVSEAIGRKLDVHTPRDDLAAELVGAGGEVAESWGSGKLLLELYEKTVETNLWGPVYVTEFPAEVSPCYAPPSRRSRPCGAVRSNTSRVASSATRSGSLVDPDDQRARFEAQARARSEGDEEAMSIDEDYLALERGLPPTAGLGIGIDRLVMIFTDARTSGRRSRFRRFDPRGRSPIRTAATIRSSIGDLARSQSARASSGVGASDAASSACSANRLPIARVASIAPDAATIGPRGFDLFGAEWPAEQLPQMRARTVAFQRDQHRKCVEALGQILAGRLTEIFFGADHVEDVVADLEHHPECLAESGEGFHLRTIASQR